MAWDVTVPDTRYFAESHLSSTATEQGAAAKQAADNKTDVIYSKLANLALLVLSEVADLKH